MSTTPEHRGYLLLPRLRIQNANIISSPHTWGFPALTAFTGFMHALQRKLDAQLEFVGVGVVCHRFEPQVHDLGWNRPGQFALTRNPVENKRKIDKSGQTTPMSIVEEGRGHLEVSLLLAVADLPPPFVVDSLVDDLADQVACMRLAGGTIQSLKKPKMHAAGDTDDEHSRVMRTLRRQLLPGFALVGRPDVMRQRLEALRENDPAANALDAVLDISALTYKSTEGDNDEIEWAIDTPGGWFVPVPVGYTAISPTYAPGEVRNARDQNTPFQFVESLIGIGQWLSPHRIQDLSHMLWYPEHDAEAGTYLCRNDYSIQGEQHG
ncbi:MAG: type I-F CRISPR-associated protein Csy2 [Panacagrimonas sp.]